MADERTAATPAMPNQGEQLELVPIERCDYCGPLEWTKSRFRRVTHKHNCPHREDSFCQAHPSMCGEPVVPRANPDWPLTSLPGTTFEDIFKDEPPQDRIELR